MTPLEIAQAAFAAAEDHVNELERELHRLDQERGAARAAGDNILHAQLNDQVNASNIELRMARAAVEEARGRVRNEQQRVSRARQVVVELLSRERQLAREAPEALAHAHALATELGDVQQQLEAAREQLAQLEPPEQPAQLEPPEQPAVEAVAEPAPVPVERDPEWPQPARMIFDFGEGGSRYYDKDDNLVDATGRPLNPSVVPQRQPEPGRKVDPQVQTAPSLFD